MPLLLIALVSAALFLDTLFFYALTPLLPRFERELALTETDAGVLVAIYVVGSLIAAIPIALVAARAGVKSTVAGGLLLFAVGSAAFGFADSYGGLLATRLLQGAAGAAVWTGALVWMLDAAPREQRGVILGSGFGAAAAGSIGGPLLGAAAIAVGRPEAFVGVAAVAVALALAILAAAAPPKAPHSLGLGRALRSRRVWAGAWLVSVPAIVVAALAVIGPLQLAGLGLDGGGIALTFGLAAAVGVLARPLVGRWSDRQQDTVKPLRLGLLSLVATLALVPLPQSPWLASGLLALALITVGTFFAPTTFLLADACDLSGVPPVTAMTISNIAWAIGATVGAASGGAITDAAGQGAGYALLALIAISTLAALTVTLRPTGAKARDGRPASSPYGSE